MVSAIASEAFRYVGRYSSLLPPCLLKPLRRRQLLLLLLLLLLRCRRGRYKGQKRTAVGDACSLLLVSLSLLVLLSPWRG